MPATLGTVFLDLCLPGHQHQSNCQQWLPHPATFRPARNLQMRSWCREQTAESERIALVVTVSLVEAKRIAQAGVLTGSARVRLGTLHRNR